MNRARDDLTLKEIKSAHKKATERQKRPVEERNNIRSWDAEVSYWGAWYAVK